MEEVEYHSVLVAFEDDEFSEEMVATAATLAAGKRGCILVLSLVNVPANLALDAKMDDAEAEAQSKIERAKLICGRRVSGKVVRVRPGQAAQAIIERARQIDAEAVVLQLTYRDGRPLYGQTLRGVLAARPTRVIVSANPGGTGAKAGRLAPAR